MKTKFKFWCPLLALLISSNLAFSQISGNVFADYNANGIKENTTTYNELGIQNVTVKAFNASGAQVGGTQITSITGGYSFSGLTLPVRIEFSNYPTYYFPSSSGANNTSNVQFHNSATTSADFALNDPTFYSKSDDKIVASTTIASNPFDPANTFAHDEASVQIIAYDNSTITKDVPVTQTGAIWGLAYAPKTQVTYMSAIVKRHAEIGLGGPGAIYFKSSANPAATLFFDLATVASVATTPIPSSASRGLYTNCPTGSLVTDEVMYDLTGKQGIGSIELNGDGSLLYALNLDNKTIYQLPTSNPSINNVSALPAIPEPGCNNGVSRPWALKYYKGKLYVGVVCSGETAGASRADLVANVYALDLATNTWSGSLLTVPLDYFKGAVGTGVYGSNYLTHTGNHWNPWMSIWDKDKRGPSPLLADIEFDMDGSMILGFMDRSAMQHDDGQAAPIAGNTSSFATRNGGDILKASYYNGVYTLENNGTVGDGFGGNYTATGVNTSPITPGGLGAASDVQPWNGSSQPFDPATGLGGYQGPGGGEFYWGDYTGSGGGLPANPPVTQTGTTHSEIHEGGLALKPGTFQVVAATETPTGYTTSGIAWYNNKTGARFAGRNFLYAGNCTNLGKSSAMGDVEIMSSYQQIEIGNRIWLDSDADGLQDANEMAAGVPESTVVTLRSPGLDGIYGNADDQTWTTATDANGNYYFNNLDTADNRKPASWLGIGNNILPGYDYRIELPLTSIRSLSVANINSDGNDNIDNDATLNGTKAIVSFNTANSNHNFDFGLIETSALGDKVWNDTNGNGNQDSGEAGIPNVIVTLTNSSGTSITTTTDADGIYSFINLMPDTYSVTFSTPAGYFPTTSNSGGSNEANDSDPISGVVTGITLIGSQINNDIDAGYYQNVNLGNAVWYDQNNNGIKDITDPVIAGATVKLYADSNNDGVADGAAIATVTTDANGLYNFSGIKPDTYIVGVTPPAGYGIQSINGGDPDNDVNNDNNGIETSGTEIRSNPVSLIAGTEPSTDGDDAYGNTTVDFALLGTGSIGNFVWNDLNGNGTQEEGEPGIEGVTVTLTYPNGETATTTTNASGVYSFTNLAPGTTYSVTFGTTPGTIPTASNVGNDGTDSDPIGGIVSNITVAAGVNNDTIDAGFVNNTLSLGNYVWYDSNNNGTQNDSETGVEGVTVKLYADDNGDNIPDGIALQTSTTDANGLYNFGDLIPGNYIIGTTIPSGYTSSITTSTSTTPNNDNNNDNNGVTTVSGELRSNYVTLTSGGEPITDGDDNNGNTTVDFGIKGTGSLGNFVWNDLNGNGIQDTGEPGINGAIVILTYPNGETATTTTNASGAYSFTNLAPGTTYSVSFTTPDGTLPTTSNVGSNDGLDSDPVGGVVNGITLTAGQIRTDIDAGFVTNSLNLGNFVWYDTNNNGTQDAGETGIAAVTVKLYADINGDNEPDGAALQTTVTGATGLYNFDNLIPGNYIVGVTIPTGYNSAATTATSGLPNNDNNTDNNGINLVGTELFSNYITLSTTGEPTVDGDGNNGNLTVDFGLKGTGAISNLVWNDLNGNGIQDGGEPGISGVEVTLTYPNGQTVTTITVSGVYIFPNLAPSTEYSVTFASPAGTLPTSSNIGSNDGIDSDPVGGVVSNITVIAGVNNDTIDAGFIATNLNLGNYVWYDINNNGTQDATEVGISGVTVKLYVDANGDNIPDAAAFKFATTDQSGLYSFNDLTPGNYIVGLNLPSAYLPSATTTTSATPNNDNNTDNNGITKVGNEIRSNYITLTTSSEIITDGDGNNGNLTMDFGLIKPLSIGSTAFYDPNNDGIQLGAEEVGIPNLTVKLYDAETNQVLGTTTTDNSGNYVFNNLMPGNYIVGMSAPTSYPSSSVIPTRTSLITGGFSLAAAPEDVVGIVDGINTGTQIDGVGTEAKTILISLLGGAQPLSEPGQGASNLTALDENGNATLDFGFYLKAAAPLPITLVSFEANKFEEAVNLIWKTTDSKNFSHFEIQKSANGIEFSAIAKINGTLSNIYSTMDSNPTEGNNYYRLKMVDLDGTNSLAKTIVVNFEKGADFLAIENPANNGEFKVSTNLKNPKFILLNSLSSTIETKVVGSGTQYVISTNNVPYGLYYLNIISNGKLVTKKVLIP